MINIEKIANKWKLGKVIKMKTLTSSQNNVYKVTTDKNTYVIKEYSKDAISNYYYLKKRKEQIKISKKLKDKGINTIIPKSYNNQYFMLLNKKYYLVYNYYYQKNKLFEELKSEDIKQLAYTQAKIHKLNIKSNLPCTYKKIDFNLIRHKEKIKYINNTLYQVLDEHIDQLNQIINKCNESIKTLKKNLCISHNDYKLLNILWENNKPILLDFDATGLANPTCCLCESAFTFSHYDNYINYDFYKNYLKEYIKEYGIIKDDFYQSLFACLNGKLQWLIYMFSKNHLKRNNYINETISMIDELILYYNNIEKFYKIYKDVLNK